jgi:hypothetical protein
MDASSVTVEGCGVKEHLCCFQFDCKLINNGCVVVLCQNPAFSSIDTFLLGALLCSDSVGISSRCQEVNYCPQYEGSKRSSPRVEPILSSATVIMLIKQLVIYCYSGI